MTDQNKDASQDRTNIGELGEFGLIDHLTKNIEIKNRNTIKGVGDDAAVIKGEAGKVMVVTTDLLVEGIHFDLMYHPLRHLGYKSVVVNLSDVYAMNATPNQITVSLAISNRFSVEALEELYEGILAACEKYGVDLIGGDTTSSQKGLVISVTAIGEADEAAVTYRSTGKAGDLLCVSGDLGAAYLGLQILEREKRLFLDNPELQPDLEGEKYVVGRQLMPEARRDIIEILEELKVKPTAMIDISDGLSSDLMHICKNSATGCKIYEEKIPIAQDTFDRAVKFNIAPVTAALNGGEDYELLFTVDPDDYDKIKNNPSISVIGHLTKPVEGFKILTKSGQMLDLTAQGWDSFQ